MVPPVQSAVAGAPTVAGVPTALTVTVPPQLPAEFPVTVNPPFDPVVFSTMPFVAPFEEMLRNVSPLAPMVVFDTFRAVPLVDVMVLPLPVTVTVPPPVALN